MILTIAGKGPLGKAILGALEGIKETAREVEADDPDLFMKALGCHAIVYAPVADLLAGAVTPAPDPERIGGVLKACNAPGVKLLVVVHPRGGAYGAEIEKLVRHGVPFVIVEASPMREELEASFALSEQRSLWLARGATASVASSEELSDAVGRALTTDALQGGSVQAGATPVDLAQVARELAGDRVAVHTVPGALDKAARTARRWFGLQDPPLRRLCDALSMI